MNKFRLKILESDRKFYDGECESVTFSISDGEYGILAGHSNMIAAVETGELRFIDSNGEKIVLSVSTGIVKVENGNVLILVDSLELPEEIDINRVQRHIDRAKEELLQKQSMREYNMTQASLTRALNRLHIKETYKGK